MIVLCLDVSPSMNFDPLNGGDTALEMSLKVARQLVQKRVRMVSKGDGAYAGGWCICRRMVHIQGDSAYAGGRCICRGDGAYAGGQCI